MVKSYYIYSNECFCLMYLIFDLISVLKSSRFKENIINSRFLEEFTFWNTSQHGCHKGVNVVTVKC